MPQRNAAQAAVTTAADPSGVPDPLLAVFSQEKLDRMSPQHRAYFQGQLDQGLLVRNPRTYSRPDQRQ